MKLFTLLLLTTVVLFSCNKEKRLMKRLTATWNIEQSIVTVVNGDGSDSLVEQISNAGKIMIYEKDPDNPSKESKLYDLYIHDGIGDTVFYVVGGTLTTDEKNNRIILQKAISDSTYQSDIVWTLIKKGKTKQTWTTFGVDSTLFYPLNNNNPGAATSWLDWTIELKKE